MSLNDVLEQALKLTIAERASLAQDLLQTLLPVDDAGPQDEIDRLLAVETHRRWVEHESSPDAVTYSEEEVHEELRRGLVR